MSALSQATAIWTQALAEPIGLGLLVSDPGRAKAQLYNARTALIKQGLAELSLFTIRTSPTNPAMELWLLRTAPPTPSPEQTLDFSPLLP